MAADSKHLALDDKMGDSTEEVVRAPSPPIPVKYTRWQKFVSTVWDPDYYLKSEAERRLVRKLDTYMLSALCFGWLMKYIDQTNLTNAYVSGMKEDLKMYGNEYTRLLTIYNAVYCVLQIPSNLVVMKVRPSWWLAGCEIGWTAFTFAQAAATSTNQVYVFRFFVAFFEAGFQPVCYFLLGSWYLKSELGKRMAIWYCFMPLGQAMSGYLQTAVFKGLNGAHGMQGWRWLYIVCGGMTIPAVILVFFLVPEFPTNAKAWYLTEEEMVIARERSARNGTKPILNDLKWSQFTAMFKHWRIYFIPLGYIFYGFSVQSYNYFGIYLKAENFSVSMRNIIPSCSWVASIPVQLLIGYLSDRLGTRFWVIVIILSFQLVPNAILTAWPPSVGLKIFAFFANPLFFATSLYYTWLNEICGASAEERGVVVGMTNTAFYAFNTWLPNLVFLQTDQPSFRKGYPTLLGSLICALATVVCIHFLYKRQQRQEAAEVGSDIERAPEQEKS
ncbi:hypothetical protein Q8F55_001613 [Vanrija albida]|uniref:Major facilitator superfamily (MFS) profile domain-containing protein n=1 Tax=Vanrija albida TaxID=181172 RepID=A0ABR3QGJ5_9TREE